MPPAARALGLPPPQDARFAVGAGGSGSPGELLLPGGPASFIDDWEAAVFESREASLADRSAVSSVASAMPPERALALDAAQLTRMLGRPAGRPARWTAPAFVREVELVRAHLRPIRSCSVLAASFGREAFHGRATPGSAPALCGSAVRVAYAIRWLELGDGRPAPAWRDLATSFPSSGDLRSRP